MYTPLKKIINFNKTRNKTPSFDISYFYFYFITNNPIAFKKKKKQIASYFLNFQAGLNI